MCVVFSYQRPQVFYHASVLRRNKVRIFAFHSYLAVWSYQLYTHIQTHTHTHTPIQIYTHPSFPTRRPWSCERSSNERHRKSNAPNFVIKPNVRSIVLLGMLRAEWSYDSRGGIVDLAGISGIFKRYCRV